MTCKRRPARRRPRPAPSPRRRSPWRWRRPSRCASVALGVLDLRLALERRRLLADLLLPVELGDAHRLLRCASLICASRSRPRSARRPLFLSSWATGPPARAWPRACRSRAAWWRWRPGSPSRARPRRRRSGPCFSCSATSILRLLHRLRRGLPADRLDVARFVGDVGDVDVDEHQADLLAAPAPATSGCSAGTCRGRG